MKFYVQFGVIFFLSLFSLKLFGQTTSYTGKASYLLTTTKSFIVDFWFTKEKYQYAYRTDDPANSRILLDRMNKRTYTNITDSLKNSEAAQKIKNETKSISPEFIYGELDNGYLTQTWIEL